MKLSVWSQWSQAVRMRHVAQQPRALAGGSLAVLAQDSWKCEKILNSWFLLNLRRGSGEGSGGGRWVGGGLWRWSSMLS